eukprot:gene21118-25096_t
MDGSNSQVANCQAKACQRFRRQAQWESFSRSRNGRQAWSKHMDRQCQGKAMSEAIMFDQAGLVGSKAATNLTTHPTPAFQVGILMQDRTHDPHSFGNDIYY